MESIDQLVEFDRDGAVRESAEAAGVSRGGLLRRAAIGGGAVLGGSAMLGLLPTVSFGATSGGLAAASDVDILNFALTLE